METEGRRSARRPAQELSLAFSGRQREATTEAVEPLESAHAASALQASPPPVARLRSVCPHELYGIWSGVKSPRVVQPLSERR